MYTIKNHSVISSKKRDTAYIHYTQVRNRRHINWNNKTDNVRKNVTLRRVRVTIVAVEKQKV